MMSLSFHIFTVTGEYAESITDNVQGRFHPVLVPAAS